MSESDYFHDDPDEAQPKLGQYDRPFEPPPNPEVTDGERKCSTQRSISRPKSIN